MWSAPSSASARRSRRRRARRRATLAIDQATRGNLELDRTLAGERRGSLLAAIDRTVTAAGSRLLASGSPPRSPTPTRSRGVSTRWRISSPMRPRAPTPARGSRGARSRPRSARLVVGRGGPRDLAAIRDGIAAAAGARRRARQRLADRRRARGPAQACAARTGDRRRAIGGARRRAAAFKRDGGFVRAGYDAALDEARALRDESRRVIAALQARYADETGVRAQDPAQQRARLFRRGHGAARRQAVGAAAQRDLHPPPDARRPGALHHHRVGELEAKIANAADRALGMELEIFEARRQPWPRPPPSRPAPRRWPSSTWPRRSPRSRSSATTCGLKSTARSTSSSKAAAIRWSSRRSRRRRRSSPTTATCRRPPAQGGRPHLAAHRPEHGRQVDLPAAERADRVLAQMGSFVPAKRATIGVVDRLFSRVGAADDLARGPLDLHGRDGRDRRHPQPGDGALARSSSTRSAAAPRPSTACRSPGRRSSTCTRQPLPRAVRHPFPRADRAAAELPRLFNATVRVRNGTATSCSCTRWCRAPPTAPTASRWRKLAGLPASVIERAKVVLAKLEAEDRAAPRAWVGRPLSAAAAPFPLPRRPRRPPPTTSSPRCWRCVSTRCRPARGVRGAMCGKGRGPPGNSPGTLCSNIAASTTGRRRGRWPIRPASLVLLALLASAGAAQAQTYPSRTITMVVTASAGGVTDVVARAIGRRLSEKWGQQVVIENRGGGGRVRGAQAVAKAAPDGHTLMVAKAGTYIIPERLPQGEAQLRPGQGPDPDHRPGAHPPFAGGLALAAGELALRNARARQGRSPARSPTAPPGWAPDRTSTWCGSSTPPE